MQKVNNLLFKIYRTALNAVTGNIPETIFDTYPKR